MTTRRLPARLLRFSAWLIGSLVALILIVLLAQRMPAVQRFLTGQVEKYLTNRLDTDLGIGSIRWKLPTSIELADLHLNTPEGDSLFRLRTLGVDLDMWALLDREVVIEGIDLKDVYGQIMITDSTSNIDFLTTAFAPSDTAPGPEDTTSSSWTIRILQAKLALSNINFYYQDDPNGLLLDLDVGQFRSKTADFNLTEGRYLIEYLSLHDSRVRVELGASPESTDTTATQPLEVAINRLKIIETGYRMQMDSLGLQAYLSATELQDAHLLLDSSITLTAPRFQLTDGSFQLDLPGDPTAEGIDYNHLLLGSIQIDLQDIRYTGDSIYSTIRQLQARERSGLALSHTKGSVLYTPQSISLNDFTLQTTYSGITTTTTDIHYNFSGEADLESLRADLDLRGKIGFRDLLLLAPQLREVPLLGSRPNETVSFDIRGRGSSDDLQFSLLNVNGPGVVLRSGGSVQHPFDSVRLAGDLLLSKLVVSPGELLPLLPEDLLPPDISWPRRLEASGRFRYQNRNLQLELFALEDRADAPYLSQVSTQGSVFNPMGYPNSRLDITLDNLLVTRHTLLAYLPPGTIPPEYRLPDFLQGTGTITGPVENLSVDLQLTLPGGQTYLRTAGTLANAIDPDQLQLDLGISDLSVLAAEIRSLLPVSLLPEYLRVPDFLVQQARIRGGLDSLEFELPVETSNGRLAILGHYRPENLDVQLSFDNFRAGRFFKGPLQDTIDSWQLRPLSLQASVTGRLEPGMRLQFDASLNEQGTGTIFQTAGLLADTIYRANLAFSHPDFRALGRGSYRLEDSVAIVDGRLQVERIDLGRWDLSDRPLELSGSLEASSTGLRTDRLNARIFLDDLRIRSDTALFYADSLLATAVLNAGENEVHVRSDIADLTLDGTFQPETIADEFQHFLRKYWEDRKVPDSISLVQDSWVDIEFEIKNPQPLTSGIIPGLSDLSKGKAAIVYRDNQPELLVNVQLPRLQYSGIKLDSLLLDVRGDTANLYYKAEWRNVQIGNQFALGQTTLLGESESDALRVALEIRDSQDTLRHRLSALVDPETDSLRVRMADRQLLNYETWQIPDDNLVELLPEQLMVNNWSLKNGPQSISIYTPKPNHVFVDFSNFDIATASRLINSEEELASGRINGTLEADQLFGELEFSSDLMVSDLTVLSAPLGDLSAHVASPRPGSFDLNVGLRGDGTNLSVVGNYLQSGALDLQVAVDRLRLSSIEPLTGGQLSDLSGQLKGNLQVGGTTEQPRLNGDLRFQEAALQVAMLGAQFQIGDQPIEFEDDQIRIDRLLLIDSLGNRATANGTIILRSSTDYLLDLDVQAEGFLALNSTEADNELYFGDLIIDADVDISGPADAAVVRVRAEPQNGSSLTYQLLSSDVRRAREENGVRRYVEMARWDQVFQVEAFNEKAVRRATGYTINADLKVDPDLDFKVVTNIITGDAFEGSGDGTISFQQFPDGRQEMTGRVTMVEGKYDFSFSGLSREFTIEPESYLQWTGDVLNPELDLTILYEVRTSAYPLVAQYAEAGDESVRQKQTFQVAIHLDGTLRETTIETDIRYPDIFGNAELQSVERALRNLRQVPSQLNQQAFALLLLQGFINLEGEPQADNEGIEEAAANTLASVLTNQLNNFANRYLGFVDVDFGYESFETAEGATQSDVRLSLSKRLLNDRLVISVDGVATTISGDDSNSGSQTYLDNISAEYLLDDNGTLRIKIFNDRERNTLLLGDVVRIGGRLVFSKDFDEIRFLGKGKN